MFDYLKLSQLLRDLLSSHPIKHSYILYLYFGESLSLKKAALHSQVDDQLLHEILAV